MYAGASGDFNPMHTDEVTAKAAGLPERVRPRHVLDGPARHRAHRLRRASATSSATRCASRSRRGPTRAHHQDRGEGQAGGATARSSSTSSARSPTATARSRWPARPWPSQADVRPDPVPIHYEQRDDHIVLITIDRPEARNSLDLHHFRDLAKAWRRLPRRRRRLGRDHHRRRRPLHVRRRPQDLHPADHRAARADRLAARSTRSTAASSTTAPTPCCATSRSTSRSSRRSTGRAWPAAWRCSAASTSASPPRAPRSG